MQMSPIPQATAMAVAVPTQAARSQEEAISLFENVPGIEVSVKTEDVDIEGTYNLLSNVFQQKSTLLNPFGIVTATRGSFPIRSTAEGEPTIATLFVASADRYKGDMAGAVLLPDQTVLAQWSRNQRPTMIQSGDTVMPLSVFGAPYGQMQTSSWGMGHNYVDVNGSGVKVVTRGCCQPKTGYMIAAFCCFFPTLSIGSCIIFCMATGVPGYFDMKRTQDGETVALLKFWSQGASTVSSRMRLEFPEQTDSKTKLAATLAALFFIADTFIDPPQSSSGSGGDGGGAPDVAVMDR
jgi:hypothetical protein